jgi:acyl transferase domain-containing protein/NADPH:quinone reductase-like Zn-dependent oxidoreductase/NADP-dependent 3-hydroxy acid dehydrogenase YdfG/acyl carrier protein
MSGRLQKQIFITGRSCRLPGAENVAALADVIFKNRDTVSEIPHNRWLHDYFLHPVPGTKGKTYTFAAGVVDGIWDFEPAVFGISPREAGQMDPQQRMLLHVAWEALEDAGIPPRQLAGKNVGVYVGCSALAHAARLSQDAGITDAYLMTGNTLALVSNRISHALDLRGPSLTIDTACSSSLFALKQAEEALLAGEIDMAIVAGANALLDPTPFVGFSAARMLSPGGRCRPFSATADGYVRAEGAVALVLERATRKALGLRRPYAALVAVETNANGRTVNVALPSAEGQAALLRRVYDRAKVDPDDLAFVEAHGTGTLVGDPAEAEALGQVLGQRRKAALPIGSIKSNIGHLEPASGLAGVLKALLALEHGVFPASLHAEALNPAIPFEALNLAVARENLPLPQTGGVRYAGVSSFGFGGANAHAILASVADAPKPAPRRKATQERAILLASAFAPESLRATLADYRRLIGSADADAASLEEICAEAVRFRDLYPQRVAVVCDGAASAIAALTSAEAGTSDARVLGARSDLTDAPAAFVFSGNGSQYAGMGLAALATDPAYARALRRIDRAFARVAGWSIIKTLRRPDLDQAIRDCDVAQPLLFADQMALVAALAARGLRPAAVMGHSGGEVAAACAAGALSLDDALLLIHQRSLHLQHLRGRGTMAAVQAPAAQVAEAIAEFGGGIEIAAENSPKSVSIVGEAGRIDDFIRLARRSRRWAAVRLAIDYPFHGAAVDEVTGALRAAIAGIVPASCTVPLVSSVTGQICAGAALDADYWCANVRRPVAYSAGVETLKAMGFKAFLEIGPAPVLGNYTVDSLGGSDGTVVINSFELRDTAEVNPVARTIARALVHGIRIDLARMLPAPRQYRRDLPRYHWNCTELRIDRTPTLLNRYGNPDDSHPLLGREEGVEAGLWLSEIDQHVMPQFCDHRVGGKVVAPGTALAEMALAAARATLATDLVELRDADIVAPLLLGRDALYEIRTRIAPDQTSLRVSGRHRGTGGAQRTHLSTRFYRASIEHMPEPAPDPELRQGDRDGARLYAAARRIGLDYGPAFALVERLRRVEPGVVEVFLRESGSIGGSANPTLIDVIGADAAFHGVIAALEDTEAARGGMGYVPIRIARLCVLLPWAKVASARVRIERIGQRTVLASFQLYDAAGAGVAVFEGVRFKAMRLVREISLDHHAFSQVLVPLGAACADAATLAPHDIGVARLHPLFATTEETHFLIEAAAQAIAVEVLARLADDTGVIRPKAETRSPYLAALIGMGKRAELIAAGPLGMQLTARAAESSPGPLLDLLAHEHPGMVAELALLAHARATLPDLIASGTALPTTLAHFGREALANLAEGSASERLQVAALAEAVLALVARWPKNRALRIAELSDGAARILPQLLRALPTDRASFFEITVPTLDEPGAAAQLPMDRVTLLEAKPEVLKVAGPFDLVLAAGILNRMESSEAVLSMLGAALSERGQIVMVEPAPSDFADLVFGLGPDWFVAAAKQSDPVSRRYGPDDLRSLARRAGLTEVEAMPLVEGCATASVLLARSALRLAALPAPEPEHADLISRLLDDSASTETGEAPLPDMQFARADGPVPRLYAHFRRGAGVDDPQRLTAARLLALKELMPTLAAEGGRLVALVPGGTGQGGGAVDPCQTALWALLRTVANEYPAVRVVCYDIAPDLGPEAAARRIAEREAAPDGETELVLSVEGDAALRVIHGPGVQRGEIAGTAMRQVLEVPTSGKLDDLRWVAQPRRTPGAGEVEIEVAASGLNYRDVMWAMGLLPEEALENGFAGPTLGIECAGTVLRAGPGVTTLRPGDRVLGFGPQSFASHLVVPEAMATLLPDGLDLEAAATVPVTFFTAWYALISLAALKPGEWVLIHGGAGGVGLAAVQIARHFGARVIATAGSPVKRSFLRAAGAEHVLDSRSLGFAEAVMELTGNRGVDVVLNGLAGAAMERSLNCLAPFGRFLELGKQDFYANTAVGLRPLKKNIAYHGIDVDELMAVRPAQARAIYADMLAEFGKGSFRALPFRAFEGVEVVSAFRLMQKSGHIGKILVRPPRVLALDAALADTGAAPFDRNATQLVVGGLGGLGLEIADWLVAGGARVLALLGRRAEPSPEVAARIERWRAEGVEIEVIGCDVADAAALDQALTRLRARRPIAGVIHSAMVLEDMPLSALTPEVLARTLPAKIAGAANLDRLTRGDNLGHFVLFSSIATLIGNHGQASYVAANGFLEGLAQSRRAEGLPGLAVGWGPVSDVGYLSRNTEKALLVKRMSGNIDFTSLQLTRVLERLLALGSAAAPVVHVSPMSWNTPAATLRTLAAPAFRLLKLLGQRSEAETGEEDLRATLLGLPAARAEEKLRNYLVEKIAHILQIAEKSVGMHKPMNELGIDSLMGVELALTLQDGLGDDIPVTSVSQAVSISEVARRIISHLHGTPEDAGLHSDDARLALQHLSLANEDMLQTERAAE